MGESRQELVAWLNSLLQLNITKVEQCGTGAALCQVFDSIYMDIPMGRVKFNVNTEYAYLQNFKVLQKCFKDHQIDRNIPVESLIKCKMQDNLEFLQWSKRHWDQYFPGGDYDALARRRASGPTGSSAPAPRTATSSSSAARRTGGTTPVGRAGVGSRVGGGGAASAAVLAENATLKETVGGLERERDFYFSKLRDIELLIQQAVEEDPEIEKDEGGLIKHIQTILYSTEDGFEIPEGEGEEGVEETFQMHGGRESRSLDGGHGNGYQRGHVRHGSEQMEGALRVLNKELQRLKRESLREFVREFGEVDTMDFR